MDKVLGIITSASQLAVKLLDYYSGLFSKGILRTASGTVFLLLIIMLIVLYFKQIGYILTRPFLNGIADWSAALVMQRSEDPGTPKPYVLHMRLSMREMFRMALADVGLYGRTDTDAMAAILVRRSRTLSEDANYGSLQGLVRRSDSLRKQSARYMNLVRAIERERAGRLSQRNDYYADASHLEELDLPNYPGEPLKGFTQSLYAAMFFNKNSYHGFRNLIRSASIRPEGSTMRFHTQSAREHFADRMQSSLNRGVPYVLYAWLLLPGRGLRFSVMRYLFQSSARDKTIPLEGERGPGYEIRFETERSRQQSTFRFEILTSGPALFRALQETGTKEMMDWAAGNAAIEGVLLGNIVPTEAGTVSQRHLLSEKYRLDNPYDRYVLADAIGHFVAQQAETIGISDVMRAGAGKGGVS